MLIIKSKVSDEERPWIFVEDKLEWILEDLKKYTLDPIFEKYGNFINRKPEWRTKEVEEKYAGCVSVFGNFINTSHAFQLLTDEEKVISMLEDAVRANQKTEAYQKAREELRCKEYERYHVPENIRRLTDLIMVRFSINGICDPMYICNVIAHTSGLGDGASHFEKGEVKNYGKIAIVLQGSYGCNIERSDIPELTSILEMSTLDFSKTIDGMGGYIKRCRDEIHTDPLRKDYLERCIRIAEKNMEIVKLLFDNKHLEFVS